MKTNFYQNTRLRFSLFYCIFCFRKIISPEFIWCVGTPWEVGMSPPLSVHCDLDHDLWLNFRKSVFGPYLLHCISSLYQIWCVSTSWDWEVSHITFRSLWPWPLISILENSRWKHFPFQHRLEVPNGLCVHFGIVQCRIVILGHCDLDRWP